LGIFPISDNYTFPPFCTVLVNAYSEDGIFVVAIHSYVHADETWHHVKYKIRIYQGEQVLEKRLDQKELT
jgi:hypothetical protein